MVKAVFLPTPRISTSVSNDQPVSGANSNLAGQVRLVTANFKCACGGCGELFLIDCTCDMPRGAKEEKDFIRKNLQIQTHVIHAAHMAGVNRLLFLGSSCIYPRQAPQPMPEDSLLTGPLESTNEAYAVAKIAGIRMCEAYRR
ncbi:MAG: NAD-dependent epimerase/dehydratase family protein, partial [Desulfobacterales bacterium]|nr:NAD-dependent epimerase/dehydratase family protein [Desulfobacterales bacterium]